MWNRLLQVLVESCVYVDPHAYTFYIATKRKAAGRLVVEPFESRRRGEGRMNQMGVVEISWRTNEQ